MEEHTIKYRIDYWRRKIGIGSVWLLREFRTAYAVVHGVSYSAKNNLIIIEYQRKDTPGIIFTEEVGYFLNYMVNCRVI